MQERIRVVAAVARDPLLSRLELAYFGFNMSEYATWMAILVYAYAIGGAGTAAIFALVQLIPAGIVAPFAASLGDRFRRERVLLAGYLWQALSLAATAGALYADAPPIVTLIVATIASASFTVTRPVQAVILPSITHTPADLTAANAVSGIAENVGIFVGPLIGGLLLVRSQPADVFGFFAAVSVLSAILVARVPQGVMPTAAGAGDGTPIHFTMPFRGFAVLAKTPQILLLVLILTATTAIIGGLDILFVATAIDLLHADDAWAGFMYAAFGLGGIAGAVASVGLIGRRRMTPALATSGGLFGLPISAIALLPGAVAAPLLFGASGAGFGVVSVAGRTLLQRVVPEELLGRVFGVLEGLTMFALAIGSVVAGLIVAAFGVEAGLIVAGLAIPALLIVVWFKLGALDRDARPLDPEALTLLRRLPTFAPLSAPSIERILAELIRLDVPEGNVLIRQGDYGDRFYVLAEGRVVVTKDGATIRELGPGGYFGEIALLRDVPRTATITAITPLRVIAIERERFLEAVTGHPQSHANAEAGVMGPI
jgi:MFS family permease